MPLAVKLENSGLERTRKPGDVFLWVRWALTLDSLEDSSENSGPQASLFPRNHVIFMIFDFNPEVQIVPLYTMGMSALDASFLV
jgi:hypothetical protein